MQILQRLYDTILSRKNASAESSYVASLFTKGTAKIAQKVGEEAVETILASAGGKREEIISETADLLFHLLVLLAQHNITLPDIETELEKREGESGIVEKQNRK